MEITQTTQIATLGGTKVHTDDGTRHALCGATSYRHMVPTTRPVDCKKCQALLAEKKEN